MTTSRIDVRVGQIRDQKVSDVETLEIESSLQKAKVEEVIKNICQTINQNETPFLFIEFQSIDPTQFIPKKQTEKEALYQFRHLTQEGKHYYCGNFKSLEMKKFAYSLQKTFIKLNQLDTKANLSVSFSSLSQKTNKQNLWSNATIKGQANVDPQFVPLFKKLLQKVSPKFIDSPIVILLQQLQSIDLNLNLKTFQIPQFIEEIIKKYLKVDLLTNEKLLKQITESKEQITISITLGHLFSIKIKGSAFLTLLKFL